jgi:hypothetical protein
MDRDRVWYANRIIGMRGSPFWCLFGDPSMLGYIPLYSAMIIKFPQRRSEFVRLRPNADAGT